MHLNINIEPDIPICRIYPDKIVQMMVTYNEPDNDHFQMYLPAAMFDDDLKEDARLFNFNNKLRKIMELLNNDLSNELIEEVSSIASELEYHCLLIKDKHEFAGHLLFEKFKTNNFEIVNNDVSITPIRYVFYEDGRELDKICGHSLIGGSVCAKIIYQNEIFIDDELLIEID